MLAAVFCTKCGEPLREGAEFCGACGTEAGTTGSPDGEAVSTPARAPLPAGERTPNATSGSRDLLGALALVVGVAITLFGIGYPFALEDCNEGRGSCKWGGLYVGEYEGPDGMGQEQDAENNLRRGFLVVGGVIGLGALGAVAWPLRVRRPEDREEDD
jgi:hypothetical protein